MTLSLFGRAFHVLHFTDGSSEPGIGTALIVRLPLQASGEAERREEVA